MFAKIGLAITFSPTGKALLKETVRLQHLFNSQVVLIHIGERNKESEELLVQTIKSAGVDADKYEVIWTEGDPASAIINSAKDAKVDLLVAGALEKEKMLKFFFGSVARKIMREFPASSLILKSPSVEPINFKKFFVSVDYSPRCERTIRTAFQFALKDNAEEFTVIRDFYMPGLTAALGEDKSIDELKSLIYQLKKEEEEKMKLFVQELDLKGLDVNIVCVYGKEGFEDSNYARNNDADIFAVTGPEQKMRFFDRFFQHDIEYSFEKLPSNLLIVR
ncbi:MAG: universal stress protein [Ignavibacteriaceae bacterium]|jgi:nucleotide-binding universal stress UspA family protein